MSCGISPAFAGLSPTSGQVAHVLRTRAPCAHSLYCYRKLRTRLACVKHAASVRSEPGSNSHLKLVVLKIKNPGRSRDQRPSERTFLSLGSLNNRTGSGTFHPLVKEQASCPAGRLTGNAKLYPSVSPPVKPSFALEQPAHIVSPCPKWWRLSSRVRQATRDLSVARPHRPRAEIVPHSVPSSPQIDHPTKMVIPSERSDEGSLCRPLRTGPGRRSPRDLLVPNQAPSLVEISV